MIVQPLAQTYVDWNGFIQTCKEVLGDSPTRELDKKGIKVGDLNSYYLTLKGMETTKYQQVIKGQISFSFLCVVDNYLIETIYKILKEPYIFEVEVNKKETLIIISTTLDKWQGIICSQYVKVDNDYRQFINKIYLWFEKLNLSFIYEGYKKSPLNDGTFILKR